MTTSNKRLDSLRAYMDKKNVDIYIIYSTDDHNSEYISDHFKFRDYISGFTGSAATMIILKEEAFLWTDGRYFLQAEEQLKDSGIVLCKSGEKNVKEPEDYIATVLKPGMTLGFDARTVSAEKGIILQGIVDEAAASINCNFCPADDIWENRPERPAEPVYILDTKLSGKESGEKLSELKKELNLNEKEAYILSSLDDIAWLLNLRGNDISYNPVFYSYLYIDTAECVLFINQYTISTEVSEYLNNLNITVKNYDNIFEFLTKEYSTIYCDESHTNYAVYSYIAQNAEVSSITDPTVMMKAIKNDIECNNLRYCNELDGVAVVRFMMWLEEACKSGTLDEYEVGLKIDKFRTMNEDCIMPSFDTICGYAANGAIVHYSASKDQCSVIKAEGSLLVDSGGQYYYGTTDITRTIALGHVSDEYKRNFTLVLKGTLALQNCVFPEGAKGANLDIMARQSLWQNYLNYNHGTGHGIGYFLNVHEGPVRISWNVSPKNDVLLMPGMVVSDEPGIYIENKYGIRIENMLLCKKLAENECGTFLGFEPLTYAPIDLCSIDVSLLNETDKEYLNSYHKLVFDKLSPYLNETEKQWLMEHTKAV